MSGETFVVSSWHLLFRLVRNRLGESLKGSRGRSPHRAPHHKRPQQVRFRSTWERPSGPVCGSALCKDPGHTFAHVFSGLLYVKCFKLIWGPRLPKWPPKKVNYNSSIYDQVSSCVCPKENAGIYSQGNAICEGCLTK